MGKDSVNVDIKAEEKRLYEEYQAKLAELKKVQQEKEAVGQVFTKGLLPLYALYILGLGPTNGNDIARKIGERTDGQWVPSTGGIYPILKRFEKAGMITGKWDDPKKKKQRVYTLTEKGHNELDTKRKLLRRKMEEALEVFRVVYNDLYLDYGDAEDDGGNDK